MLNDKIESKQLSSGAIKEKNHDRARFLKCLLRDFRITTAGKIRESETLWLQTDSIGSIQSFVGFLTIAGNLHKSKFRNFGNRARVISMNMTLPLPYQKVLSSESLIHPRSRAELAAIKLFSLKLLRFIKKSPQRDFLLQLIISFAYYLPAF